MPGAKTPKQRNEEHAPWLPTPYEEADAYAIQALAQGIANPSQQKQALKWIVENCAGVYDMTFRPGDEEGRRNSDFAEGKRHVGNQIVKLTKVKIGQLRREP